jgi:Homing endonuclease associated repeat
MSGRQKVNNKKDRQKHNSDQQRLNKDRQKLEGDEGRPAFKRNKRQEVKSREEAIAAIQECARRVGHTPTYPELRRLMKMTHEDYRKHFATLTGAIKAAGLVPEGAGHKIDMIRLFEDWGGVARKVGKCPTAPEYSAHGKYSLQPMNRRFARWCNVAPRMREFAERNGLAREWSDVMEMVTKYELETPEGRRRSVARENAEVRPWARFALALSGTIYGPPLGPAGMAHAPVNEAGVLVLFGMVAVKLGFRFLHVQAGFPDCEALLEVEPGRWLKVRIEVEFRSKNFFMHGHDANACDLIVCWEHDWEDCRLPVLELKEVFGR